MKQVSQQDKAVCEAAEQTTENVAETVNVTPVSEGREADGKQTKEVSAVRSEKFFSARRIAYIAVFTAISVALRFFQFPILSAVPFLQFDFSDSIVLICAYALGPVSGVICDILKELIYGLSTGFKTMGVGELANIVITLPFLLLPSIMYKKHKGVKSVILWLSVACLVRTVWSIPVNLLLNFPVFTGFNWSVGMQAFIKVWHWATLFNLIKNVILSVVVMLLYKSVSRLIHMINAKFDELHDKKHSARE